MIPSNTGKAAATGKAMGTRTGKAAVGQAADTNIHLT